MNILFKSNHKHNTYPNGATVNETAREFQLSAKAPSRETVIAVIYNVAIKLVYWFISTFPF